MGEKRAYLDEWLIHLLSVNHISITVVQLPSDEIYGIIVL